ncbi:MAG TPA: hypothetical protein VJS30_23700 [Paraburkholderia sp.]|nr:hypothetical protein [Paraburkholderia sp.]
MPTSLSVNQTCLPSGVAARSGQNGLACLTVPTILVSLAQYLDHLTHDDLPLDPQDTMRAYLVFHDALLAQISARTAASAAKGDRP